MTEPLSNERPRICRKDPGGALLSGTTLKPSPYNNITRIFTATILAIIASG